MAVADETGVVLSCPIQEAMSQLNDFIRHTRLAEEHVWDPASGPVKGVDPDCGGTIVNHGFQAMHHAEIYGAESRPSRSRFGKLRAAEESATKHRPMQASLAEGRFAEIRPLAIGPAEISLTEIRPM
jgi:hypothetical protein